jgi:hypothetical protein
MRELAITIMRILAALALWHHAAATFDERWEPVAGLDH